MNLVHKEIVWDDDTDEMKVYESLDSRDLVQSFRLHKDHTATNYKS